jgi:hypothetical protein
MGFIYDPANRRDAIDHRQVAKLIDAVVDVFFFVES